MEREAPRGDRHAGQHDRRHESESAMNGIHDLGGMHGLGPIEPEANEPVFHEEWERRTFAMTVACGFLGRWNLDLSRSAREQMDAAGYLSTSYYEHWLFGLERLLDRNGLV